MRHIESKIQIACVNWFRLQYPYLSMNLLSIPNGGARNVIEGKILKAEGIVAGASDLFLFYPSKDFHGLAIEMKTQVGRQSPNQKLWQKAIEKCGYKYVICRSLADFMKELTHYLAV